MTGTGALSSREAAPMGETVSAVLDGVTLTLVVDPAAKSAPILRAGHEGARDAAERTVLDALCATILLRPIQEAADHGAIYIMDVLAAAPVPGIRTPHNAGSAFVLAERLLRRAFDIAQHRFGLGYVENRWNTRPSPDWTAKSEAEQADCLKPVMARFLSDRGHGPDELWITGIEKGRRVTVAFTPDVSYALKPELLMSLERRIRRDLGEPLELFMEEMKDANKIRRL